MESFFLNLGLSYTWSKALPYIIMVITGIAIGVFLFKRSGSLVMKIISIIVIGIPFGIYFAINPIYEGDFTNSSRIVEHSPETGELTGSKLVVISMPGCKYCKESVFRLKEVKDRHKDIVIEYVVASYDSSTLEFYTEAADEVFPVRLADNPEAIAKAATDDNGTARYPSFVLIDKDKPMKVWNNNTFGVMALDEVVKSFK